MDIHSILNIYEETKECLYKGERYSVRDNGAVLRHARAGKRTRKEDNRWTFGKANEKTGYMEIGLERVHRIVAFAFLGEPPTPQHVVDHIDTNRRNNRPQNLRWVTRLENTLNNPITRKKIEHLCGSIEAFLNDPSIIRKFADENQNFEWMRTVTPEEARFSYERMCEWVKEDRKEHLQTNGRIGEWIYRKTGIECGAFTPNTPMENEQMEMGDPLVQALTSNALQRHWRTQTEFPCCPMEQTDNPIKAYFSNLAIGKKFCGNQYGYFTILDFAVTETKDAIFVLCENKDEEVLKKWSLARVTYENDMFVHTSEGTFFSEEGAKKKFTLAQGKEWTGGNTIDDYC